MTDAIEEISTPLPLGMCRENTCCFTGHRIIAEDAVQPLTRALKVTIYTLCTRGYRYFMCGGALGFDMLAEETVIRGIMAKSPLELILALPCTDQTRAWRTGGDGALLIERYRRIKGYASSLRYTSVMMTPDCMKLRNAYMTENSSVCVAYYDTSAYRSGTGQTYRMAQRAGLEIINLWQ